jgi:hypothetical protein
MQTEDLPQTDVSRHDWPMTRVRISVAPYVLALLLFCLILVCLPILATTTPPVFDYPNHLGRTHIHTHLWDNSLFREVFTFDSLLLPNVITDIWIAAFSERIGTLAAGQLMLLLIVALTFVGAFALNAAATKQPSTWPLLVALFLYNEMFFWGFLNYLLGIAFLLWGCAAWLLLERRSRLGQLTATALFALLILFSHLVAFGLFAVAIAIFEVEAGWRRRRAGAAVVLFRIGAAALVFVPAVMLYLAASPIGQLPFVMRFDQENLLFNKLSPFTRILSSGNTPFDLLILGGVVLTVLAARLRRSVSLEPRLAAVAAAFTLLAVIMPHEAMGSYLINKRIAVPSVLLLLSALRPRDGNECQGSFAAVAILALVALRSGGLMLDWQATGRIYASILDGIRQLPEGTLVIPATSLKVSDAPTWFTTTAHFPPMMHVASYATILRQSVTSNIFARRGQNPIIFQPPSEALQEIVDHSGHRVESDSALRDLTAQAIAVRQTDPVFATRGVHLLLLGVTCDRWRAVISLPPFYCGGDFSIIEIPAEFRISPSG